MLAQIELCTVVENHSDYLSWRRLPAGYFLHVKVPVLGESEYITPVNCMKVQTRKQKNRNYGKWNLAFS